MYDRTRTGERLSHKIHMLKTQNSLVYLDQDAFSNVDSFDYVKYTSIFLKKDTGYHPGALKLRPFVGLTGSIRATGDSPCTQYPQPGWYKWYLTGDITSYMLAMSGWDLQMQGNGALLFHPPETNYRDICLLRAATKIASPDVDAPLFFAEIESTLRMLKNPLRTAVRFYKRGFLSHPKSFSPRRTVKYLSDKWLEYRYGMAPLLSDIEGAMDAVKNRREKFDSRLRYVSASNRGLQSSVSTNTYSRYDNLFGGCWREVEVKSWYEYGVVGRIYYGYNSDYIRTMAERFGFSWNRFDQVVWELVPYSFVVDWFMGVGDWLEAHRAKPYVRYSGFTSGVKMTYYQRRRLTYVSFVNPSQYPQSVMRPTGINTLTVTGYDRRLHDQLPAFPQVNWDFRSLNHVIDSLALSLNIFKRK